MSEVMQQGILRMPPECWMNGEPLDERQRHSAYVAAADRILKLEDENAALREELKDAAIKGLGVALKAHAAVLSELERENAALRTDAERYRYIKNSETVEVSEILQSFCVSITFDLDAAIDTAIDTANS